MTKAKRSSSTPTAAAAKKTARTRATASGRAPNIEWAKNPDWTWTIITYLTEHTAFRIKLFSDSTADAAKAGRAKAVAKDGKQQQYAVLAQAVFAADKTHKAEFAEDPKRFIGSVDTRLRRLKKEYIEHKRSLGQTGAGLASEDVTPDSKLSNLVDVILKEFPWWRELHGFWRELPNYNPIGVTNSTPGVDHSAQAASAFEPDMDASGEDPDAPPEDADAVEVPGNLILEDNHQEPDVEDEDFWKDDGEEDGNTKEEEDDDEEEEEEEEVTIVKSDVKGDTKSVIQSVIMKSKGSGVPARALQGRDAGLAKAQASGNSNKKTNATKHQSAAEKFQDIRKQEAERLERKRQRDHQLKMEAEKTKRMKYEFKNQQEEYKAKIELEKQSLETLRLRIRLAELEASNRIATAAATSAEPATAQVTSINQTPPSQYTSMQRNSLGPYNLETPIATKYETDKLMMSEPSSDFNYTDLSIDFGKENNFHVGGAGRDVTMCHRARAS